MDGVRRDQRGGNPASELLECRELVMHDMLDREGRNGEIAS